MHNSSLLEAFKTFTTQEMKEFGEFVISPFFNKNVNVIKLFEIIRKNYPDLNTTKLEKEAVYKKIFPNKPYKDSTIRLLMFYLYEIVEKFIAYNRFAKDDTFYGENLVKELLNRGMLKEFEKNIEKINKIVESTPIKDEGYYMNRFIFKYEYMSYVSSFFEGKFEKYITKEDIEFVSSNLTYYYLIRIFKFYSVALNVMHLYNIKIDTTIFENIAKNFDPANFKDVPLIAIYYNTIMILLKQDEESYYYNLKKLVYENEQTIDRASLSDLCINLENYCHRMGRLGIEKFMHEALEIYNFEIKCGICFSNGFIPDAFYNSYVVTACRLGDYDQALDFIEKYKMNLNEQSRDAYYYYCRAYLENERNSYEKALEYLSKVKMDDLYMKMDVRCLQSRIYDELGWFLPLQSLLDTFKKTVQNNKLMPDVRKKYYLHFIKYLNHLNNIKQKPDMNKLSELKYQLEAEEYFPYKAWLIRRAEKAIE